MNIHLLGKYFHWLKFILLENHIFVKPKLIQTIFTLSKRLFFITVGLLLSLHSFGAKTPVVDTINQFDHFGKRTGYWVVDENNQATTFASKTKRKEGRYIKGRKNGAWICYYTDGVTPRLIGEYQDNRPGGAFFRFDKKGELIQASSVPRNINQSQSVEAKNELFACRMMFHNSEMVAGQVFFEKRAFVAPYAYQFWTENSLEQNHSVSNQINYAWLNQNYPVLYSKYLHVRVPHAVKIENPEIQKVVSKVERIQVTQAETENRNRGIVAPIIYDPKVAKGMTFQLNGFNKLYTESNEIWIDGLFRNGQLKDGKVFVYDRDGVLLKVRIFKDGLYVSDGGL